MATIEKLVAIFGLFFGFSGLIGYYIQFLDMHESLSWLIATMCLEIWAKIENKR